MLRKKMIRDSWVATAAVVGLIFLLPMSTSLEASPGSTSVALRVTGSQSLQRRLVNARELAVSYRGEYSAVSDLVEGRAEPRSLALGDLQGDGTPGLLTGYATPSGGIVTVQRGNRDAFAARDPAAYADLRSGRVPPSLLPDTAAFSLPEPADWIASGDFNQDGHPDVLAASRGGGLYVLLGDGAGGLATAQRLDLPGGVTALATGEFGRPDGVADVAVAVEGSTGAQLLLFDGASGGLAAAPLSFSLPAPGAALAMGNLDRDGNADLAVAAGSTLLLLHGEEGRLIDLESRIERVALPFAARALDLGHFVWDRANRTEIAILAEDGRVVILQPQSLDTRAFTSAETAMRRTALRGGRSDLLARLGLSGIALWTSDQAEGWRVAGEPFASGVAEGRTLLRSRLSAKSTDDLLLPDARGQGIQILSASGPESSATVGISASPIAALELAPKVTGGQDLVVLRAGHSTPMVIEALTSTFNVTKNADTNDHVCDADCSLREAIEEANGVAGPNTINVPPGTYNLSLGELAIGSGTSANNSIVGSGVLTIHQSDGLNRVFDVNPAVDNNVTVNFTGLMISGGLGDTFGGGGIVAGGTGNATTVTNCIIFSNSTTTTNNGGGISWSGGGTLTITGSTISGNTATNAVGGGVAYNNGVNAGNLTISTSTISANTASAGPGAGQGGGVFIGGVGTWTISQAAVNDNIASNPIGQGGGIYVSSGTLNVHFSRTNGNTGTGAGANVFNNGGATVNADDNWWGVNTGPGTTLSGASASTWLQLRHIASPGTISRGATSTLTADLLGRNSGGPIAASNLVGLPTFPVNPGTIFSNAVLGTLSGAGTQFVDGMATATYTAGSTPGTGHADATVNSQTVTANITITAPDLTLTKTHSGNFRQGDIGDTYTITVTNSGNEATSGTVTVADTLPSGLTATAITGTGWTCNLGTLTCTRSDALGLGASYPAITLTVNVANNAPSSVTNTATVSGGNEFNTGNDTATDPTTVIQVADLTITKTHTGNFTQGETGATYTITVSNGGPGPTSGTVTVTDTLPTGLTATALSGTGWTCNLGTLTCTRGDALPSSSSYPVITLTVNVANNAPASVTNTATVSGGGELNTGNDTATDPTTVIQVADLTITKTHTGNFTQGQTGATYTITVSNAGPGPTAGTVTVVDTLPTGLTATAISGTGWTCNLGTLTCTRSDVLAASSSYPVITLTVNVANNAPASVINTATVSGGGELNTANDTASDPTTVNTQADLAVTKSGPASVFAGNNLTYAVTVTNNGPSDAQNVSLTDTLPVGTSFASQSQTSGPAFTLSNTGNAINDTITSLTAGASASFQFVAHVNSNVAGATTLSNTANVASSTTDPTPGNNSSTAMTTVNAQADLAVVKAAVTTVQAGNNLNYSVTVSSNGPSDAQNVSLTDTLPTGTTFVSQSQTSGPAFTLSNTGNAISDTIATLPAGTFAAFQFVVHVNANVANGTILSNTAAVSSSTADPTPANNSSTATTAVGGLPDLTLTKTHTGNFTQGQTGATYTITVSNVGTTPTAGTVTVTDALPTGLTATGVGGTGWSCDLGTLTCTRSDALASSSSYPAITLTVDVANNAPGSVTNMVTVSGGGETNTANDTASDPTTICPSINSTITAPVSVRPASTGNTASVADTGIIGTTYNWTIFGGTITSGQNTTSITFTAGSAGSVVLSINIFLGACGSNSSKVVLIAVGDFTADGKADIVLRNSSTGQDALWVMNGTAFSAVMDLPMLADINWRFEGVGDFNGDGKMDIVLRNYSTGQNALWLMNGNVLTSISDLPAISNTNWHIEGVGDLNGDGMPDILLRNYVTGQNSVWLMNGVNLASVVDLPGLVDPNWHLIGGGDFDGNGKTDLLWRNQVTGQDAVWLMNGTSFVGIVDLPALTNTNYRFGGIADYNGDGKPDIVLRNNTSGQNAIWTMNGTALSGIIDLPGLAVPAWEIVGPR